MWKNHNYVCSIYQIFSNSQGEAGFIVECVNINLPAERKFMWKPPGWFGDLRGPLLNSYSDENLMGIFPSPKKGGKGKASD